MSTDHAELERELFLDFHRRADGIKTVPFGFNEVQFRARRIRRNRRITAVVGIAAVLMVIVSRVSRWAYQHRGATRSSRHRLPAPSRRARTRT